MHIRDTNLSFQSKIKFIDAEAFRNKIKTLNPKKHYVGWPWTADTMKRGKNLYTTQIMDCIAVGIMDGNSFSLCHLGVYNQAKAKSNHQKGFNISNIKRRLLQGINLENEKLHAIIFGGFQLKPENKYNVNKLNKIKRIFDDNKIPYTVIGARKDVHYFGKYSIYYASKEDTIYLSTNLINARSLDRKYDKEIVINKDGVEYNTYEREKQGFGYKTTRQKTNLLEYFKSQFRQVKLSKFDELA